MNELEKDRIKFYGLGEDDKPKGEDLSRALSHLLRDRNMEVFLKALIARCGGSRTPVWDKSSQIHYNAGIQEIRNWVMNLILDENPALYIKLFKSEKGEKDV